MRCAPCNPPRSPLPIATPHTTYRTHHGPIVAATADGHWIAEAIMFAPVPALEQSYALTKATDYTAYMKVMELKANTSNNTVYADSDGHIAYMHPQFIPRRDDQFDYTRPVDGADPRTDWHGLHALNDAPHLLDPATGWIENTNNWPYTAAGTASPKKADYPRYMDTAGDNMRGLHAVALLTHAHDFTLPGLVAAAYDAGQPGFDILIPHLIAAYDRLAPTDPLHKTLAEQIALLRGWNCRWSAESIPTTLAVLWGEALWHRTGQPPHASTTAAYDAVLAVATPQLMLQALAQASDQLTQKFGSWRQPWGDINRVQRLTDDIDPVFSDAAPSLAVPFTSAQWGSLASITGPKTDQKKRYGNSGNSFVAAIEFGPRIKAVAVTAGGESGDPGSKHFNDEAGRYASGKLREVYFYPDQLKHHTERRYHPGE
jgi:acyl-homoserine-lactone acylase